MTHIWQGVLREYASRLNVTENTRVITLGEGGTPLVAAPALCRMTGLEVSVKFEGMNPTGSFKDRGMTVALSRAVTAGAQAVVCASTGNTSASAAAYAAAAGITAAVLRPRGNVAPGKLAQAVVHGARVLEVEGNFDDCLVIARKLAENYPVTLVNSVNPDRIDGQKTAAFEVSAVLGDAPEYHFLPVGNAGNYSAYYAGYREDLEAGNISRMPRLFGFQAAGSAPLVSNRPIANPETVATAIRIGNPASWKLAVEAREGCDGHFAAISDRDLLAAQKLLASQVGLFVEPASAISVAGLLQYADTLPAGSQVVCTVTGHGLKDSQWALHREDGQDFQPTVVPNDTDRVAAALELERG